MRDTVLQVGRCQHRALAKVNEWLLVIKAVCDHAPLSGGSLVNCDFDPQDYRCEM